jgi:long-subunit fatty acid transport protein
LGAGWQPFRGFSFGANFSYLWGDYSRSIVNSYSDSYINTLSKYYTCDISSYNVNFGLQYTLPLSKKDKFTIGLTYGLGHKLGADPECQVINTNSQTSVADTATYKINNGLKIPETIGAGFAWYHNNKWKLGADYTWQKWSKIDFPEYNVVNNTPQYILKSDMFKDRHKVTLGGEYCYNILGRNFLSRIRYRFGVSYATPYLKINNNDGPKELSISGGFGIPIINNYNNRSVLNISCQWVHNSAKSLITENIFRINIGITFNEMWFMKWKVE